MLYRELEDVDVSEEQLQEISSMLTEQELDEPTQEDWDSFEEYMLDRELQENMWAVEQHQEETWG